MSSVVDLAIWRTHRRRGGDPCPLAEDAARSLHPAGADRGEVDRLDRAVDRLHVLVSGAVDGAGRLEPSVETELLAIVGELTVGLVHQAADRAERLAVQLGS
jgi:hypothetical protein